MSQSQRLSIALTIVNATLFLGTIMVRARPAIAGRPSETVLRGRALEIVDANGQVRFSVSVAAPMTEAGKQYPDRVLLRIGSPGQGPGVKLVSSVEGTDLDLMHGDRPRIHLSANAQGSFIELIAPDGTTRSLGP